MARSTKSRDEAFKARMALEAELYRQIGQLKGEIDWLKKSPRHGHRGEAGIDQGGARGDSGSEAM